MKLQYIFFSIILMSLTACEEVVDVDLSTARPRLVVDASIDWVKGTDGTEQLIRLTQTTGYYDTQIPVATGAVVTVTAQDGPVFNFIENPGTGNYICTDFVPVIGQTYVLDILFEDQQYTATESFVAVPDIGDIEQDDSGGFFGDEIEVKFFFQDDVATEDYYLIKYVSQVNPFPAYGTFSDKFTNGNLNFDQFSDEDLAPGQTLDISLYGISRRYHEYMNKLLSISGNGSGGPFSTAPAKVRGNVLNLTDDKKYPMGYFRLAQVDATTYTIE